MSKRVLVGLFLWFFLGVGLMAGKAQGQEIVKVGVLPFRVYAADREKQQAWPTQVAKLLSAELGKEEQINLVEDEVIRRALDQAGPVEGEEQLAREVGRRVGADYMVIGSITQINGSISLDMRILEVFQPGVLASVFGVGKTPDDLASVTRHAGREVRIKVLRKELISKVLIEGNRTVEESAIRAQIKTKEEDLYSPAAIRDDLKTIYQMGYFQNVWVEKRDWDRKKAVVFVVEEKPIIKEIKFSGNQNLKNRDLLEVMDLKPRTILNLNTVQENVSKILKKYRDDAYYAAEVQYELEAPRKGEVIVHYKIKEHEKIRIQKITFSGNIHYSDETLKNVLPETKEKTFYSWIFKSGIYKEDILERDLDAIIAFYLTKGFLEVKVGKPKVTADRQGITVSIPVEEGRQYKVGRVDIQGDLIAPKEDLFKLVPVYVGEIFNRDKLRQSVSNLTDRYADKGYAFVDVSPQSVMHPEQLLVDLTFLIRQGNKVYFERINILGNTKSRDNVIRRDLRVVEGELYSLTNLKRSRDSLNYTRYFKEVNVSTKKGSADDKMVLNVEVEEGPTGAISAGAGYSTMDLVVAMVSVSQNNLFGRGQRLIASAQLGSISKYYNLSFIEPRLFDSQVLVGADIYSNFRNYTDYWVDRTGTIARFGFPLFERFSGYTQYRYEKVDTYNILSTASDVIKSQQGISSTSSIFGSLRRDTRDSRIDPSKGSDNSVSMEYAGGALGGTNYFTRYSASSAWYTTPFWDLTFVARSRISYIAAREGHTIPLYERFRLGGIYTVRGFKTWSIGPKAPNGEVIGGDKELLFNLEMVFPIAQVIKLKGVIFFDAGNAWDVAQPYSLEDLRTSAGIGFRWMSPMGPLRLEWGYNLNPRAGENQSSWDFTIGAFF